MTKLVMDVKMSIRPVSSLADAISLVEHIAAVGEMNFTDIGEVAIFHHNKKPYRVSRVELQDYLHGYVNQALVERLGKDIAELYDSGKKPLTHVPFNDAFELIKKYAHHH